MRLITLIYFLSTPVKYTCHSKKDFQNYLNNKQLKINKENFKSNLLIILKNIS